MTRTKTSYFYIMGEQLKEQSTIQKHYSKKAWNSLEDDTTYRIDIYSATKKEEDALAGYESCMWFCIIDEYENKWIGKKNAISYIRFNTSSEFAMWLCGYDIEEYISEERRIANEIVKKMLKKKYRLKIVERLFL